MNAKDVSEHPCVGVKLLDRDHDCIEELFNEIRFREEVGLDDNRTKAMVRRLAQLVQVHFALEEGMMSSTNYPGTAVHQLHHQWLMEQIETLTAQRGHKAHARNAELLKSMIDAHLGHIRNDDLHYGKWLDTQVPRNNHGSSNCPPCGHKTI